MSNFANGHYNLSEEYYDNSHNNDYPNGNDTECLE